jgi:hypothetical protein
MKSSSTGRRRSSVDGSSVSNPHAFHTDPDPTQNFNSDPDPGCQSKPDPGPSVKKLII